MFYISKLPLADRGSITINTESLDSNSKNIGVTDTSDGVEEFVSERYLIDCITKSQIQIKGVLKFTSSCYKLYETHPIMEELWSRDAGYYFRIRLNDKEYRAFYSGFKMGVVILEIAGKDITADARWFKKNNAEFLGLSV